MQETQLINERIGDELAKAFDVLEAMIDGDLLTDIASRLLYATDASAYRELPLAVCRPRHETDLVQIVRFARENKLTIIPRAAGTSLAGQVVGRGLIVDVSRYMNHVLEINEEESWVRVQPGVILDELNQQLENHGLFFSPETSTSNRCMIGGMIGNNSSGLHSLVYGTTREHLDAVRMVLHDGEVVEFRDLNSTGFEEKCKQEGSEGDIYRVARKIFGNKEHREKIKAGFPDPEVVRRNTGYALDEMANSSVFQETSQGERPFNYSKLIAGSEGTLGLISEATLHLDPLPPKEKALIPVHLDSVMEAIRANLIALDNNPSAVELMDRTILDLTEGNLTQKKNRFFVNGSPGAILIIEFVAESIEELHEKAKKLEKDFRDAGLGYHFPFISGEDISRVWALRKAGLGVLSKMKGDAKPVSVIEDTSVVPSKLEGYIQEFDTILSKYKLQCVYHAHISVGELHLRPVLNLKDKHDVELFHTIAEETAHLVKKYGGSLSGEHGDGRLRGEFIPIVVGQENYELMRKIKQAWDPNGIFNKGKIIDSPPMNTFLRYKPGQQTPDIETIYDFSADGGIIRHIEQCNGSGDCRKTELSGGTMCPSYMATREEYTTTRARANILREYIGRQGGKNIFNHPEVYDILDLCLSCKACKSECPSSVDMAKLKGEFLQHWYDANGVSFRTRAIANIAKLNQLGMIWPGFYNLLVKSKITANTAKSVLGFAKNRSIPTLSKTSVSSWCRRNLSKLQSHLPENAPEVSYFVDEFTNYSDAHIGITAIKLLSQLGVRVFVYTGFTSGRTYISKGLLRAARNYASKNVEVFRSLVHSERPLIGTEPSAILSFRDEYPDLVDKLLQEDARELGNYALMIEEYLSHLIDQGFISNKSFTTESVTIKLHGHCQQKAVASTKSTIKVLSLPVNYKVSEIPSGCCGMAGSFGYEKEHFDLSMKVGELVLFPEVRKTSPDTIIAIAGTSCRHQVKDGTGRMGKHPVEILYEALKS